MAKITNQRSAHDVIRELVKDGKSVEVEICVSRGGWVGPNPSSHSDCYLKLDGQIKSVTLDQALELVDFVRNLEASG